MLLIGCTAGAFTACSDGDDDQKPSCPITEYTVPSTAEIGGFYTVTGKGFEASAQLFLRNASGTETAAADQTVTAAGIECTVPSTLTAGVYTVVVKQNGSWDLGSGAPGGCAEPGVERRAARCDQAEQDAGDRR